MKKLIVVTISVSSIFFDTCSSQSNQIEPTEVSYGY